MGQIKHKMWFEKFIECPKWVAHLAWNEMLIHGDVEGVSLALLMPNGEEVWMLTFLIAEMLFQTAAWLVLT